jgi:hypothetical protein
MQAMDELGKVRDLGQLTTGRIAEIKGSSSKVLLGRLYQLDHRWRGTPA